MTKIKELKQEIKNTQIKLKENISDLDKEYFEGQLDILEEWLESLKESRKL